MADRFPLILNTSANQIQEIASGDSLDLTGTNIANAGIITAGNVIIGAATTDLVVNGDARITGILTIGTSSLKLDGPNNLVNVGTALTLGHTQGLQFHTQNLHSAGFEVNQVNASGIITATGADINGDIDVDGHTNLDNVSVAGVSTFAGNADFSAGIDVTGAITATGTITSNDITIQDQQPRLNFVDNAGSPNNDYLIQVDGGNFVIHDSTNTADKILIAAAGYIDINSNTNFAAGIDVTGNATVSGNLSVGGVLTYEDVTNVDSVGVITARSSIKVTNASANAGNYLEIKTNADSSSDIIKAGAGAFFIKGHNIYIGDDDSNKVYMGGEKDGKSFLRFNNSTKIETTNTGVVATGIMTATTFSGSNLRLTDDGAASPILSVMTDDGNPWGLQVGNSTYNSSTTFGTQVYVNNTGEGYQYHIGSGAYKDFHFYQHNQSQSRLMLKFEADDNSVELYGRGTKDLETTGTGVVVTGVCTATSFVGGGSGLTSLSGSVVASALSGQNISGLGNVGIDATLTARNGVFNDNGGVSPTVQISTDDQAPWAIQIKNDSYWNHASNGWKCYQDNSGNFYQTVTGNGAFINHYLQTINGGTTNNAIRIDTDRAVTLYHQNNPKLKTITSGIEIYGGSADWSETNPGPNKGSIHLDPNDTTNHFGSAITFGASDHDNGQSAQAGIYTRSDGSYGTQMYFATTSSYSQGSYARFMIDYNGHVLPTVNGDYDLGASGKRWRNIYTTDLQLSNEGKTNDVDGTWGDFTIQEGESDLFLINNRSGKKYKFNLTEVS